MPVASEQFRNISIIDGGNISDNYKCCNNTANLSDGCVDISNDYKYNKSSSASPKNKAEIKSINLIKNYELISNNKLCSDNKEIDRLQFIGQKRRVFFTAEKIVRDYDPKTVPKDVKNHINNYHLI